MKLAISNIAWPAADDDEMFDYIATRGYVGLEIAPTRIIPKDPYLNLNQAVYCMSGLYEKYGLRVASMQSIWFGRTESIYATPQERKMLVEYSRRAVDFAVGIACPTLVFGNPKNRSIPKGVDRQVGIHFFRELATYASLNGCVFAIEPNPAIYGTNFINKTIDAFDFARNLGEVGFQVNVDFGTIIENGETVNELRKNVSLIRHVHISEPYLAPIHRRVEHDELLKILTGEGYIHFVSIEMKYPGNLGQVKMAVDYLGELAYGL